MSLIKVTSEDLETLSSRIGHGSSNIQDQLTTMEGEVRSTVGGDWQGAASSEFNSLWEEWQRSAVGLKEALDGISRLLREAGSQYHQTEEAIRSSMA